MATTLLGTYVMWISIPCRGGRLLAVNNFKCASKTRTEQTG